MSSSSDSFQTIRVFNYAHEAHLVASRLESEGIETFIFEDHSAYATPSSGGRLQVRAEDAERAIKILDALDGN